MLCLLLIKIILVILYYIICNNNRAHSLKILKYCSIFNESFLCSIIWIDKEIDIIRELRLLNTYTVDSLYLEHPLRPTLLSSRTKVSVLWTFMYALSYFALSTSNLSISNISLYRTNILVPSYKISLYLELCTVKTTRIIESSVNIAE